MEGAREDADVLTSSDAYARRFAGPVGAYFLEVQAKATLALLPAGASVLEVGGGHGQLTGALTAAGHAVTVFGSDPACAHRVQAWVDMGHAQFRSGDLLKLPFEAGAFDAVLAFRLLPHVARWHALVAELCRVAGTAVIVDYPTTRSVNAAAGALFGMKKSVEGDTRPFAVFSDVEVREAFAERGFAAGTRRAQFLFPMALHRALGIASLSRGLEAAASLCGLTSLLGSPVILKAERRG
jgi:SAM-dependent methyltransferase